MQYANLLYCNSSIQYVTILFQEGRGDASKPADMAPVIEHLALWETEAPFQIAEEAVGDSVLAVSKERWEGLNSTGSQTGIHCYVMHTHIKFTLHTSTTQSHQKIWVTDMVSM